MKSMFAALVLAAGAVAVPALATPITYTFTGVFSGLNGGAFTDVSAVFTGLGDTDDAYDLDPTTTIVPLSSFSALSAAGTFNFTSPMSYFVNRAESFSGFLEQSLATGFVRFYSTDPSVFSGYDGVSSLALTGLDFYTDANTSTYGTDRGDVLITSATGLTLSAVAGAVPEPATWALMIGGLAMTGVAMRRRKPLLVA